MGTGLTTSPLYESSGPSAGEEEEGQEEGDEEDDEEASMIQSIEIVFRRI